MLNQDLSCLSKSVDTIQSHLVKIYNVCYSVSVANPASSYLIDSGCASLMYSAWQKLNCCRSYFSMSVKTYVSDIGKNCQPVNYLHSFSNIGWTQRNQKHFYYIQSVGFPVCKISSEKGCVLNGKNLHPRKQFFPISVNLFPPWEANSLLILE